MHVITHRLEVAVAAAIDRYGLDALERSGMFVRDLLVQIGVNSAMIEVSSHGKNNLLVPTPDQTPEPRNRRVEVTVR